VPFLVNRSAVVATQVPVVDIKCCHTRNRLRLLLLLNVDWLHVDWRGIVVGWHLATAARTRAARLHLLRRILLWPAKMLDQQRTRNPNSNPGNGASITRPPSLGLPHGAKHCYQTYYDYLFHF
jgi:hypothetical protein